MNYFLAGHEELHNELEQQKRQERSSEVEINWMPVIGKDGQPVLNEKSKKPRRNYMINGRLKTCRIGDYLVTLESCTCKDYERRRLPCKHMYRLAQKLRLFTSIEERSQELIADFSKGYASGWHFVVRPCNYAELAIKWQEIKGKNKLTQGELYNFQRGSVFYDSVSAYEEEWIAALKKINHALQIDSVRASSSYVEVSWENNRYVRRNVPIYGEVRFTLYKSDGARLEKLDSYECRQDEFLKLLKEGQVVTECGEMISAK